MKLKIENIGMIRYADIKLDGLTIIAGENDTGKSTVGKLIFSLVKAFNRYEQDLNESKSDRIIELVEKVYFQLRRHYDFEKTEEIRDAFHPRIFLKELKKREDDINDFFDEKIILLKKIDAINLIEELEPIKNIYLEDENKELVIKRALTKAFISEFYLDLSPKNSLTISSISLLEGTNKIFDIAIKENKISNLKLHDDLFFNDVTFIETPIYLQMYELIRSASNLFEISDDRNERKYILGRPKVALHVKDLISKLENAQYFSLQQYDLFDDRLKNLLSDIFSITKSFGFSFDKQEKDFFFNKNEKKFKAINTATGIKSFGIIQLLIQANMLNERTLLVIDEPEIHLHPKWQVEYAKLIVALVKNDIPVLLTSHSPEIIQALNVFSEQFGIKDRTAYYLAETDGEVSDINDVTDDINKIFVKLAEPLHNLVWG